MKLVRWRWSGLFLAVVLVNVAGSTTVFAQDQSSAVADHKENQKASKHRIKAAHFGNNKSVQATPGETSQPQTVATQQAASQGTANNGSLKPAKKTEVSKGKRHVSRTASNDTKKKPDAKKGGRKAKQ